MSTTINEHANGDNGSLKPSDTVRTEIVASPQLRLSQRDASRLLLKMDLCLMPTVALLYLFCFIDRANIGRIDP